MAVRIRRTGEILCAAQHPAADGDIYIDDGEHYHLTVELKVLVTELMHLPNGGGHASHGQWRWINAIPSGIEIDPFYLDRSDI